MCLAWHFANEKIKSDENNYLFESIFVAEIALSGFNLIKKIIQSGLLILLGKGFFQERVSENFACKLFSQLNRS